MTIQLVKPTVANEITVLISVRSLFNHLGQYCRNL